MNALTTIQRQIKAARGELQAYQPTTIDWNLRALTTARALVPWLLEISPTMKDYVQDVLNAPTLLRSMWQKIRNHVTLPKAEIEAFEKQLQLDEVLRETVTGEVVSSIVTKYLLESGSGEQLKANGRSDYPDLYLATFDYTALPQFKRKKKVTTTDDYGAAVKSKQKRPVRIPDGLEIKTCRERIAVDCHHPHLGLHLVLLFSKTGRLFTVDDIRIAFLRSVDYKETQRNTTATTVKYSFNGDRFISLLNNQ